VASRAPIRTTLLLALWLPAVLAQTTRAGSGDPWWDSLQGSEGMVVGNLDPRFGDLGDDAEGGGGGDEESGAGESDAGGGTAGSEGPPDPAAIDPDDPAIAALIDRWLRLAEPPENATQGADLHYDRWGRKLGRAATGIIRAAGTPDYAAGTSQATVWGFRTELDSVDHCTLGEYVLAQIEAGSIEHCRGRYRPPALVAVPDLGGLTGGEAVQRLESAGLAARPVVGARPRRESLAHTVAGQDPPAGTQVDAGSAVTVTLQGAWDPGVAVPDVLDLTAVEAQRRLEVAGFEVTVRVGAPAASRSAVHTVAAQRPSPGTRLESGGMVTLVLRGQLERALVSVPDVRELKVHEAKQRLEAAGFAVTLAMGAAADREGRAHTVIDQSPAAGGSLAPGAEVRLTLRDHPDSARAVPDVVGLDGAEARRRLEAAGFEVYARAGSPATRPELANAVASQRPPAGVAAVAGSAVELTVAGDYLAQVDPPPDQPPPVEPPPVGSAAPFIIVAQGYMPDFEQLGEALDEHDIDMAALQARAEGMEEAEPEEVMQMVADIFSQIDPEQVPFKPLDDPSAVSIRGDALKIYRRAAFTPGSRWNMPFRFSGKLEGTEQTLELKGNLLLEVVDVVDSKSALARKYPAVAGALEASPDQQAEFTRADGRLRMQTDEGTADAGPIRPGWTVEAKRESLEMIVGALAMFGSLELDCFVATVVYRDPADPRLATLRRFRDRFLRASPSGRSLIEWYYRHGPGLARQVLDRPGLRAALPPLFDVLTAALDDPGAWSLRKRALVQGVVDGLDAVLVGGSRSLAREPAGAVARPTAWFGLLPVALPATGASPVVGDKP